MPFYNTKCYSPSLLSTNFFSVSCFLLQVTCSVYILILVPVIITIVGEDIKSNRPMSRSSVCCIVTCFSSLYPRISVLFGVKLNFVDKKNVCTLHVCKVLKDCYRGIVCHAQNTSNTKTHH
jgi:hypothetical protein